MATLHPEFVYADPSKRHSASDLTMMGPVEIAAKMIPIAVLVALVLGGIYGGLFTPVEAGAIGAAGALVISFAKRRLDWNRLWTVLQTGMPVHTYYR